MELMSTISLLATSKGHGGLVWGVILLVIGTLHLVFRRFYARRQQAIHDARQDTAPSFGKPFFRRHSSSWYLGSEIAVGVLFVVLGLILVIANA
jgi:hypothetical protein